MSYAKRKFGIITNLSGIAQAGIIANNVSTTDTAQTAAAQNEKGETIDLAAYSVTRELSVDGLFTGSLSATPAGSVVSLGDNISGLIASTSVTESNADFLKASLSIQTGETNGATTLWTKEDIEDQD